MIRPLVPSLDPYDLYDLGGEGAAGAMMNLVPDWTQIELSRIYSGTAVIAGDEANNSYTMEFEFSDIWTPDQRIMRASFGEDLLPNNQFDLTTVPGFPMSPRFAYENSVGAFGSLGNEGGSASWTVVGMIGGASKNDAWSLANVSGLFGLEAPPVRPGGMQVRGFAEAWLFVDEDRGSADSSIHWSLDAGDGASGRVTPEWFPGVMAAGPYPLVDWALLLRGGTFETVTAVNETVVGWDPNGGWNHVGTLTWKLVLS